MKHFFYLFLLISGFAAMPLYGGVQEIMMDTGLPDKCINGICKDKRGLMWIGTQSGLCLYDGFGFITFHNKSIINHAAINKMVYDPVRDLLWVASDNGLFKITCRRFLIEAVVDQRKWTHSIVTNVLLRDNGQCFASFKTGEIVEASAKNDLRLLVKIPSENYIYSYPLRMRHNGNALDVFFSRQDHFYRYLLQEKRLFDAGKDTLAIPLLKVNDRSVTIGAEEVKKSWETCGDPQGQAFLRALAAIDNIFAIHFIAAGKLLIISRPCNVYQADLVNRSLACISSSDQLNGRVVKSSYLDAENVLWIGTNKGLLKIIPEKPYFDKELITSPPTSVRSLVRDETGNFYAGTYYGLFKREQGTGNWVKKDRHIPFAMINVPGKYLYFVEEQLQFHRINKYTGVTESDFYRPAGLRENGKTSGYALALKNSREILIGTNSGLAVYDLYSNTLMPYNVRGLDDKNTEVRFIKILSDRILLATNNGLFEINEHKATSRHFSTYTRPALSANTLNFVDEDKTGRLWVCTESGGVNIVAADRDSVAFLNTSNGLSNNTTYDIVMDRDHAWISTYTGLSGYDTRKGKFYNFFARTDGLSDDECNRNAFFKDPASGKIYFGTINGINSFHPGLLQQQPNRNHLFVSAASKWDNGAKGFVDLDPSLLNKPLVMHSLDHSLLINLALSDYSNQEKTVFSYRVKGLFDNWVNVSNQHSVQLNGLLPGSYTVEVRALDSHGMSVSNVLVWNIIVLQPFYRAFWFYLLLFFVALLVTGYIYYLKMRSIKKLNSIRQQIASDLHDEVGSLLTRITMGSDSLRQSRHSEQEKLSRLGKISALSRAAASSMNDILWTIDTRNNFSGSLADRIREHAEEMLLPLSVEVIFDFSVLPRKNIPIEVRKELYLIFKESVNNIAKHSNANRVSIIFHHDSTRLFLEVVNDGCMARDKVSSRGQGLKNIRMRADRIRAIAEIEDNGATFSVGIKLPC